MYLYSGKCRQCKTGIPTALTDINDKPLFTGDIVMLLLKPSWYTENEPYCPEGLTTITANHYTTYSDGSHVENTQDLEPFVMGIKSEQLGGKWHVLKVKSYQDVVDGEHWPEFGFNYKMESKSDEQA
jgi:hypothetical protein